MKSTCRVNDLMAHGTSVSARISFRPFSAQILVMNWISMKGEFGPVRLPFLIAFISTFAFESWVLGHHGYCRMSTRQKVSECRTRRRTNVVFTLTVSIQSGVKVEIKRRWNYNIPWAPHKIFWAPICWRTLEIAVDNLVLSVWYKFVKKQTNKTKGKQCRESKYVILLLLFTC